MLAKAFNDYSQPPISVTPWEYLIHNTYKFITLQQLEEVDIQLITVVGGILKELLYDQ
jgi:hypothetical protein